MEQESRVPDSTSLREAGGDLLGALVIDKNGNVVQASEIANGTADAAREALSVATNEK